MANHYETLDIEEGTSPEVTAIRSPDALISRESTPLPKKAMTAVLVATLSEPFCSSIFFPYMYFMVRDFGIAEADEQVGIYTGILAASFYIGQFCTNVAWGLISDRFGRKPVLIVGLVGNFLTMFLFGLSKSYAMALTIRFASGLLNGNTCVIKSVIAEITDETNSAMGFALFNLTWSLGSIFGPVLGGYASNPAQHMPQIFSENSFFTEYPYFLPTFISSIISLISCILFKAWFPSNTSNLDQPLSKDEFIEMDANDDVPRNPRIKSTRSLDIQEVMNDDNVPESRKLKLSRPLEHVDIIAAENDLKFRLSRDTIQTIVAYTLLALGEMILGEVYALWVVMKPSEGGLLFSSSDIGFSLAFCGIIDVTFQWTCFSTIERWFGAVKLYRGSIFTFACAALALPFISQIENHTLMWTILLFTLMLKTISTLMCYTTLMVVMTNSTKACHLGRVNGINQMFSSLVRALGPAFAGALWTWSISNSRSYPLNYHLVFIITSLIAYMAFVQSWFIPEYLKSRSKPGRIDGTYLCDVDEGFSGQNTPTSC